jgi:septum formation topological specificity factor MinE
MDTFTKGDIVSFYSDVLKKRIAGVVVKHWACDRYKVEISENNQPRYVYISEYNLRLL